MNEELQKALATLLAKTTSAAEVGVSFLQAELPEVIQQLLLWHAVKSGIFFVIFVGLAIYFFRLMRGSWIKHTRPYDSYDLAAVGSAMASCIAALAAMLSHDWLQIIIAPKVYLIEYAAGLAK